MTEPIEMPCVCVGTPHETDTVYLHEKASAPMGIAFQAGMREWIVNPSNLVTAQAEAEALIMAVILRYGIVDWTVVDAKGDPLAATPSNIADRLSFGEAVRRIGDRGAELYTEELMRPFVELQARVKEARQSRHPKRPSSGAGPTDPSTSANPSPGRTPQKRSRPSSPTSSAGKLSVVRAS